VVEELIVVKEIEKKSRISPQKPMISPKSQKSTELTRRLGSRQPRRPEIKRQQERLKLPPVQERLSPKTGVSRSSNPVVPPTGVRPQVTEIQQNNTPKSTGTRTRRATSNSAMTKSLLYAARLLILGVGIGAIAGTLLSVLDPTSRISAGASTTNTSDSPAGRGTGVAMNASNAYLTQENVSLKTALLSLATKQPTLMPGVFMVDLDSGVYVDINGSTTFSAASMIKFPILVAFFQDVDAGKIRLDEMLSMDQSVVATGSGEMQYKPVGSQFTALEVASKMSIISDNTATNMLINRLGGAAALNQRFRTWGLTATEIRNSLPDLEGTNSSSPRDLANLMTLVSQGNLLSLRSRDRLMDIMRRTVRDNLLPSGLGEEASIAHKTGDIGSMLGDVGLVDMPNGKRYIAVVMVKRPNNDPKAAQLITAISRTAYQQWNQPQTPTSSLGSTVPKNTVSTSSMQYPSTGTTP